MIIGMNFGEREEMLALSKKRLEELKKTWHKAVLVDWDSVRVVFLTEHDPRLYHGALMADAGEPGCTRASPPWTCCLALCARREGQPGTVRPCPGHPGGDRGLDTHIDRLDGSE